MSPRITSTDRRHRTGLLSTVLIAALLLGGCAMFSGGSAAGLEGTAMTDAQTRAQVVEPAKRIVRSAGLNLIGAAFRFASCTDQIAPPFRGRVGMGFTFPADVDKQAYLEQIVAAMVDDGWIDGPPPGKRPHGRVLHMGGVMAIVAANPDYPDRGYIQILGECRNTGDHTHDSEVIVDELTG